MSGRRSVESTWRGGLRCDVKMGDYSITVDEPASVGGSDQGPEPTSVFLASIASCFTLAMAYSAKKQSVALHALTVNATGTYSGPRFSSVTIHCEADCDPDSLAGVAELAKRVCYVTNTLTSDLKIDIQTTGIASGAT